MRYPTRADYQNAIHNAHVTLMDPSLKGGRVKRDAMTLPVVACGSFSAVFHMDAGGRSWAVRCFIGDIGDAARIYAAIGRHLATIQSSYFVGFQFQDAGVKVNGVLYPLIQMEWVSGQSLKRFLSDNLHKAGTIQALADTWRRMLADLVANRIAHGDLQHENVLIQTNGAGPEIKLIDYDTVVVPDIVGWPENNAGLPSFQHPRRKHVTTKHLSVDAFSGAAVYASLLAFAKNPRLWHDFDVERREGLLFDPIDFEQPARSRAFIALDALGGEAARLASTLRSVCLHRGPLDAPHLEEILGQSTAATPPNPASPSQGPRVWTPTLTGVPASLPIPPASSSTAPPNVPPISAKWWSQSSPAGGQAATAIPPSGAPTATSLGSQPGSATPTGAWWQGATPIPAAAAVHQTPPAVNAPLSSARPVVIAPGSLPAVPSTPTLPVSGQRTSTRPPSSIPISPPSAHITVPLQHYVTTTHGAARPPSRNARRIIGVLAACVAILGIAAFAATRPSKGSYGDSCRTSGNCSGALLCVKSQCRSARASEGESCDGSTDCDYGLSCATGRCRAPGGGEGDSCSKASDCINLHCVVHRCRASRLPSGRSCETSDDCVESCLNGVCGSLRTLISVASVPTVPLPTVPPPPTVPPTPTKSDRLPRCPSPISWDSKVRGWAKLGTSKCKGSDDVGYYIRVASDKDKDTSMASIRSAWKRYVDVYLGNSACPQAKEMVFFEPDSTAGAGILFPQMPPHWDQIVEDETLWLLQDAKLKRVIEAVCFFVPKEDRRPPGW